ncbi:hypothetical protein V8G54_005389 [Vigna mungo]|uniref:Uncharacterized protein n=1 Tax=Vigna mungo TaxID=3915 RepID=A0AAQ3P0D2_VIGMU
MFKGFDFHALSIILHCRRTIEIILGTASKIVIKSINLLYTVIYNWMKYKTPFKLLAHLSYINTLDQTCIYLSPNVTKQKSPKKVLNHVSVHNFYLINTIMYCLHNNYSLCSFLRIAFLKDFCFY